MKGLTGLRNPEVPQSLHRSHVAVVALREQRKAYGERAGSCGMLRGDHREWTAMPVKNPNVKSIRTTIEIDKDGVETVLVVETDLELNAADPAFDVAKVDALIEAATKSFAASGGTIDRIHLVPVVQRK